MCGLLKGVLRRFLLCLEGPYELVGKQVTGGCSVQQEPGECAVLVIPEALDQLREEERDLRGKKFHMGVHDQKYSLSSSSNTDMAEIEHNASATTECTSSPS